MRQERKRVKAMKKMATLLITVMILAGSMEMAASAQVGACGHQSVRTESEVCTATTTHPLWVGNKPNGEPILVPCTINLKWIEYKQVCNICEQVLNTRTEHISETHSIHH